MSEVEGKLLTCDVCGKTVFLKYVGDGETDGGFTRWRKYEDKPEGWSVSYGFGTLCPSCAKRIRTAIDNAVSEIRGEHELSGR